MIAVRFTAVLLGVLATALCAQNTPTGQVVITVVDQSGAVIPGASIGIIQLPVANPPNPNNFDWVHYALHTSEQMSTRANTSGEGTFRLTKGSYAVSIAAEGFARFLERVEIRDESIQSFRATLLLANGGCGVCVVKEIDSDNANGVDRAPLSSNCSSNATDKQCTRADRCASRSSRLCGDHVVAITRSTSAPFRRCGADSRKRSKYRVGCL